MRSRRNNKRPRKYGRKTRSRRQKGGTTIFTPTTKEELKDAMERWIQNDREGLGNISEWDTSNIRDMGSLFSHLNNFNEDISRWDVSSVTNMAYMFLGVLAFNQPIGSWNVSNVTDMRAMFYGGRYFNQPIGSWDVSNVTNMYGMFYDARAFNQPIGSWDVSNVTNMHRMFFNARAFNQPIGSWDVSKVTDMRQMFDFSGYRYERPTRRARLVEIPELSEEEYNLCDRNDEGQIYSAISLDPLTKEKAVKPPSASGNNTCYDREEFKQWLNNKRTHPITREPIPMEWINRNYPGEFRGGKSKRKTRKKHRKQKRV